VGVSRLTAAEVAEAFEKYSTLLKRESDRGAVIVGAAILDDLLQEVVVARLVSSPEREDELFDGYNSPCSSFGSRIDLAYRIGSITARVRSDLHLIRRMRNDAAHTGEHRDFESPQIQSRLRELVRREGGLLDIVRKLAAAHIAKGLSVPAGVAEDTASLDTYVAGLGWRGSWEHYVAYLAVALRVIAQTQHVLLTPDQRGRTSDDGA
jgi:hypothetical protein